MMNQKKTRHLWLLAFLLLITLSGTSQNTETTFISWNIRYDNPADGENRWEYRKKSVVEILKENKPAFIGLQEALVQQLDFINKSLTGYGCIGIGRDIDGGGEYSAILFDTSQYHLLRTNTFWLSETPQKISTGWDAVLPRICTVGLFSHRDDDHKLLVFNTHFDHVGENARLNSASLILDSITNLASSYPDAAIVLMGDFNDGSHSETIKLLANYFGTQAENELNVKHNPIGTYNGFNAKAEITERIDYIFALHLKIVDYQHISTKINGKLYPSDHLPVLVKTLPDF